jgi:hypothetical protein
MWEAYGKGNKRAFKSAVNLVGRTMINIVEYRRMAGAKKFRMWSAFKADKETGRSRVFVRLEFRTRDLPDVWTIVFIDQLVHRDDADLVLDMVLRCFPKCKGPEEKHE